MLDGYGVVSGAQVPFRQSMRMFTEVGRRVHVHCTGVGKALLAQLPRDAARELVQRAGLPRRTTRTITDVDELMAELERTAARGYAVDDGEQETGVRCIAVPVLAGTTQTALSVSGPEGRVTVEAVPQLAELLKATAAQLAAELREDAGGRLSARAR